LSSKYVYNYAQVKYAIQYEQALTLDDVLARRIRLLFLDPQVCVLIAREVAIYMAKLLKRDVAWIDNQVEEFNKIAQNYVKTTYLK
jgi:glycerol-3-phosphate dehydrogenase